MEREKNMSEDALKLLDNGTFPRIAINNGNRVVEVHEGIGLRKI